jgi:hypothetical protein
MGLKKPVWIKAAAIALPGFLVLLAVFAWYSAWTDATNERMAAEDQIRRLGWLAEHRDELKQRLLDVKSDPQLAAAYLPNAGDDEATANLQRLVKQAIDGVNAGILSAQPLPATAEGDFKVLTARFQISITGPGLVRLLTTLENSTPYVFVDSAEIGAQQNAVVADPSLGDPAQRPLIVQMDVRALMLAGSNG